MESTPKIALVTGGNRGLGRNTALRLAEKGFGVIITYNSNKNEAEGALEELQLMGPKAAILQLDMNELGSFDGFLNELKLTLKNVWDTGKFDFLVNNAGIGATIMIPQVTEEGFDRMLNIHFKGVYFFTQKCLPLMNDGGSIVNLSSGTTRFANPGYSVYASMKGAIEVFTRYLAKEVGPRGITANVVAPGPVETDFNNALIRDNPDIQNRLAGLTALGRTGRPEDIGGVIAFLCSEDGHWINGQ